MRCDRGPTKESAAEEEAAAQDTAVFDSASKKYINHHQSLCLICYL